MTSDQWVVLKFGGTSVSRLEYWQNIKAICEKQLKSKQVRVVVVCSALSGVSNKLTELIDLAVKGKHLNTLDHVIIAHLDFADSMGISDAKTILRDELEELKELALGLSLLKVYSPQSAAKIMSFGELMLTRLAYTWLKEQGVELQRLDIRKHLFAETDTSCDNQKKQYLSAFCGGGYDRAFEKSLAAEKGRLFLTQGFIAGNKRGETVLLGRGGSDVSAALIASKLCASRLEIWSDVPGMFTANPRQISSARIIKRLDYVEAQELAFCGAKVLHPKCLIPLQEDCIPLELKWIEKPDCAGTSIGCDTEKSNLRVKAVVAKSGVYMISMDSHNMWQQHGFLADAFSCFKRYGISIDLVATSQSNVTVTLDDLAESLDETLLENLLEDLSKFCKPKKIGPCSRVSLVGKNIKSFFPELGTVLETFKEKKCYLITQSSSELNFSFLVAEKDVNLIVKKIHALCFGGIFDKVTLGKTWDDLHKAPKLKMEENIYKRNWWYKKIPELIGKHKKLKPQYVYNLDVLRQKISDFKKVKAIKRVNYAIKANSHPEIIKTLYKEGFSFDCVSFKEVEFLQDTLEGFSPERIVFTPNFAPIDEYRSALEMGCVVTLDNLYLLDRHGEVFRNKEVFIRVDPGAGKGHHPHVKTAGIDSKFGIPIESLAKMKSLASKYGVIIKGLHAHLGSGVLDAKTWLHTANFLASIASDIPSVRYLNLGGGFGVPENSLQQALDFEELNHHLQSFSEKHPQFEVWVEPGRYLVAECGVLLMDVTQLKHKPGKNFIGVNTGMNSLIRPSLYGSYHEIVNLSRLEADSFMIADVVGPICETGDVLGYDRCLPSSTTEGDIILLGNAGAYGRVMSSNYNKRAPADELILN